jgi:glycolate oxidase iron-sulfur subunit
VQVLIPSDQTCCSAFLEHTGLDGAHALHEQNRRAFGSLDVDAVVANSSGCGLALGKSLQGKKPVRDVMSFLGELGPVSRPARNDGARVYVDLPCHLVHGQKMPGIPVSVLNATGYRWELAPQARDCCGSGGVYNIQKPENSREILARKSEFLNHAAGDPVILATSNHVCMMQWNSAGTIDPVILATSNHVCMMQWNSAGTMGLVKRPYSVRHVIQLLDPGPSFGR